MGVKLFLIVKGKVMCLDLVDYATTAKVAYPP